MHESYEDITSRISEPPKWYDEHSVPRYCDFHPNRVANIYADEVALVEIACQSCGMRFLVAFSSEGVMYAVDKMRSEAYLKLETKQEQIDWIAALTRHPLRDSIESGAIHYGDPPNIGCCAAGPTMNCDDLRICEYWTRVGKMGEWERDKALEIQLDSIYGGE